MSANRSIHRRVQNWKRNLVGCAWGVFVCALAMVLTKALPTMWEGSTFLLFYVAVVVSSWVWGRTSGLLVTGLSTLTIAALFMTDYFKAPLSVTDSIRLGVFVTVSGLVVALANRRRQAERRLRESERYFRLMIEHTSDVVTILDRDGAIRYESPSVERVLGFAPGELIGCRVIDLVHPDDQTTVIEFLNKRLHTAGSTPRTEIRMRCRDRSYRTLESVANVLLDEPGVFDIVMLSRDISERAQAAESFRALLESAPDGIVGTDAEGHIALLNSQAERLFGYTREELLGKEIEELIPERLREVHRQHRTRYTSDPQMRPMGGRGVELLAQRKGGTEFPVEISLSPIRMGGGMLVTSIIRDATERKKAEAQKAELIRAQAARAEAEAAQQRFYDLVQDLDAIVWELDWRERQLTFVSNRATQLLGYRPEHWVGPNDRWIEHVHPEDREMVRRFLNGVARGGPATLEYRALTADGRQLWLRLIVYVARDEHNEPRQLRGLTVDVTERKQAEETMRVTEKLAATGRLAASIAHEINNPMGAVTNLLYLIETTSGIDEQTQQYARLAQDEMNRIAQITRQMLAFYRDSTAPVPVSIPEVLDAVLELYARRLREDDIAVERKFADVEAISAFPGEMRQVFSNLLLNAVEAVGKRGRIRLKVSQSSDWADLRKTGIRVTFADNGSGIRPEVRQHIFEPFFTTKGENGTGLGLWVSHGIIRKHGGTVRVRSSVSESGSGTVFSIFLPGAAGAAGRGASAINTAAMKAHAAKHRTS